ncbi:hypothetical protein AAFF_G00108640 [Aldrovandia affinis]|uniref:Uncharacterized protein n=1 Tax=Aldrovandia affinis TaxID=143900 RepID=A0AAD7RU75_9TELE|nr:hypothetical protein AAFF_G00108640 [Aldrovandia affinis]
MRRAGVATILPYGNDWGVALTKASDRNSGRGPGKGISRPRAGVEPGVKRQPLILGRSSPAPAPPLRRVPPSTDKRAPCLEGRRPFPEATNRANERPRADTSLFVIAVEEPPSPCPRRLGAPSLNIDWGRLLSISNAGMALRPPTGYPLRLTACVRCSLSPARSGSTLEAHCVRRMLCFVWLRRFLE